MLFCFVGEAPDLTTTQHAEWIRAAKQHVDHVWRHVGVWMRLRRPTFKLSHSILYRFYTTKKLQTDTNVCSCFLFAYVFESARNGVRIVSGGAETVCLAIYEYSQLHVSARSILLTLRLRLGSVILLRF